MSARREDSFCALLTLGEVYAVLTGLPLRPRIIGANGIDIVTQIRDRVILVSLTEVEYIGAIEAASATIVGGAIYDALIARCAIKAGADMRYNVVATRAYTSDPAGHTVEICSSLPDANDKDSEFVR